MISKFVRIFSLAVLPFLALAETAEQQQARIERLEQAVLAPCCYTQTVAIHQSEIAVKMRLEIARWVAAGKPDGEILDTYARLYGAKVLVDPRTVPRGWLPLFPWFVMILGTLLMAWWLLRWRQSPRPPATLAVASAGKLPDFEDE